MNKSAFALPASLLLIGIGYLLASLTRKQNEQEEQDPRHNTPKQFNKDAGEPIVTGEAAKYTKAFRKRYPKNTTFANYCGRTAIEEILKNTDCAGLRVYRAINDKGKHGIIVVGVTKEGKDITQTKALVQQYALAESYNKCESNCDNSSILYS